jgi:ABC-2 type transport system permease protein
MNALLAIARKDLRLLVRDRTSLFWTLGFPLIMALFFGSLFGDGGDGGNALPVAVIDEDGTAGSKAFVETLSGSAAVKVLPDVPLAEAKERVRRGQLVADVRVAKGFGSSWQLFGEGSPIEVGIDPSRRAEKGILQGVITATTFRALQARLMDTDAMRSRVREGLDTLPVGEAASPQDEVMRRFLESLDAFLGDVQQDDYERGLSFGTGASGGGLGEPFRMVEVTRDRSGQPRSAFDISFPSAILWGVLGAASTFAMSMMRERLTGTLLRLRAAPLSRAHVLAGKALACALACVVVMMALTAFGHLVMKMRIGSVPLLLLAILCTAACFTGIMMLLSVTGRTLGAVSGTSWGINVVMAMLGGGTIPLAFMPPWLRTASHLSPVKWGILSLEGAIWRDFTLVEMVLPCGVLLGVGVAAFLAGSALMARREG